MKRTRQLLSNTLRSAVRCWCTWSSSQPRVVLAHRWSLVVVVGGSCASSFGRQCLLSSLLLCCKLAFVSLCPSYLLYSNSYSFVDNDIDQCVGTLYAGLYYYRFVQGWSLLFAIFSPRGSCTCVRGVAERHHAGE